MALRRSIEQWRLTVPKAVVDGSAAQAMYCIADAKHDIEHLERVNVALAEALEEAIAVTESCKAFHDEQVDLFFTGKRANWRKASTACFDEIDVKPEEWRDVLAAHKEG